MPFLESVEEGLEKAKELQNTIGDDLDPQNEQDKEECCEIGTKDHPDYALLDPANLENSDDTRSGLFKTIELTSDERLINRTESLDKDQR